MSTIDYLPIANGGGANVESQAQYVLDLAGGGALQNGYITGVAKSIQVNKTLRQSSMISAAVANFISQQLAIDVLDDGVVATLITNLTNAVKAAAAADRAGGYINKFRNATCMIAKRGATLAASAGSPVYMLDGHMIGCTGAAVTVTQVAGIGRAANSLKINGQAGVTDVLWKQPIESIEAAPFAGQNVVFRALVNNGSGASITPTLTVKHANATDNWATSTTDVAAVALQACPNGVTTLVSLPFVANAAAGNGMSFTLDFGNGLNGNTKNVTLGDFDVRLNAGTGVLLNTPELRDFSAEWVQCQRYLPGPGPIPGVGSGLPTGFIGATQDDTIGNIVIPTPFVVPARIAPTGVVVSSTNHFNLTFSGGLVVIGSLSLLGTTTLAGNLAAGYAANSYGGNNKAAQLYTVNAAASLYFTGAELNGAAI